MPESHPESLKGQLLIAMPGLADPNFNQTITCICEHSQNGAVGLVINRVQDMLKAKQIFDELKIDYVSETENLPIHIGGPVHIDEIFILHGPPFGWEGCFEFAPNFAMSNTIDIIKAIAIGKGPESFIISLGCAGWGPGQLEAEIKQNAWLTFPASKELVFNTPADSCWEHTLREMGIEPALISDQAGHA